MTIWHSTFSLEQINQRGNHTMASHLGIFFTKITDATLTASMPVDHRTLQPLGRLNGGASVALAETVGSTASNLCVNLERQVCVGLSINANHVRAATQGSVFATASPIHIGRSTHVWQIKINDDNERLICLSRLTMSVLQRKV